MSSAVGPAPKRPPPLGRVCIVMMSALGDAVHTLPVITALKRHDPSCRITWILQPGPASLVRGHPDVDEIIVFRRARGFDSLRAFRDTARELRGREFDLVLDLQVYFKAGVVTALTRAPVKLGFDRARARDFNWLVTTHRIPAHAPQHVQDQYFEFLEHLGVSAQPIEWKLGPWANELDWPREFFARIARPVVTFVVGSSDPHREWLPERWAALGDALYEQYGLQPVIAGGRSDRELATEAAFAQVARHAPISTLGIPLRQLVALLDGSKLVVSVNSGPMHMAVAVDTPVISLMGHWNPKRTGPYRFRDLIVDAYGRPGEDYPISMEKRPSRMADITVEQVLEKVRLWSRRDPGGG